MSDFPTVPGDHGQPVPVPWLTGSEPNPRIPRITALNADDTVTIAPPNRWAAFTNDELDHLLDGLKLARGAEQPRLEIREGLLRWQRVNRLADDVAAELEARAAQRTEPA